MSFLIGTPQSNSPSTNNFTCAGYNMNDDSLDLAGKLDGRMLWPRAGILGGMGPLVNDISYEYNNDLPTGQMSGKRFTGVTRNAAGTAVGNVTVKLFNTSTGLLVDTEVSDAAGNYELFDPNNVACFVVAYLAGSPDTFSTTVNTLTGT